MDYTSILMLILLVVVFYFMLIRPENKRKKQAEEMRSSLKKGDKITTIGGIVGTVVTVGDATLVIETSEDRVRLEITKWAISSNGVQTSTDPRAKRKAAVSDDVPEEPVDEMPSDESSEDMEKKED